MERYKHWEQEYQKHRYLQYLNDIQLSSRGIDIVNNLMETSQNEKIGIIDPRIKKNEFWSILWTHFLKECRMRKQDYHSVLGKYDVKLPKSLNDQVYDEAKRLDILGRSYLVKYGEKKFLKEMYDNGEIRIKSAKAYDDPSMNSAIQDNELRLDLDIHPDWFKGLPEAPLSMSRYFGNIKHSINSDTNFYIYCLASILRYRLFSDFEYDSCLIIYKPGRFLRLLKDVIEKSLPGWTVFGYRITYVDPIRPPSLEMDIVFTKHFRYWYQHEYRIACIPPSPEINALPPLDIRIGSLADFCRYIEIDK